MVQYLLANLLASWLIALIFENHAHVLMPFCERHQHLWTIAMPNKIKLTLVLPTYKPCSHYPLQSIWIVTCDAGIPTAPGKPKTARTAFPLRCRPNKPAASTSATRRDTPPLTPTMQKPSVSGQPRLTPKFAPTPFFNITFRTTALCSLIAACSSLLMPAWRRM